MRYLTFPVLILGLLAGYSTSSATEADITPVQAVVAAAEQPISGTFVMEVRGAGRKDGRLYLNSESDYRDQRCLTIAIPDAIADILSVRMGGDLAEILKGRTIRVTGTAVKTKIVFRTPDGRLTGKYYYQTHVAVTAMDQIAVK